MYMSLIHIDVNDVRFIQQTFLNTFCVTDTISSDRYLDRGTEDKIVNKNRPSPEELIF